MTSKTEKPKVFVDADVLFAGAASPNQFAASEVVLRMSEITLIEAYISEQVATEVERNLRAKFPAALTLFQLLLERAVQILPNPAEKQIEQYLGKADSKDLPILVAAIEAGCEWLVTFNGRHFQRGVPQVKVLRPGLFLTQVRYLLTQL